MKGIKTYNELLEVKSDIEKGKFAYDAITEHKASDAYKTAIDANSYASGKNATIKNYEKVLYDITGAAIPDMYSANHKTASGFFKRFITQEAAYLLGNGISFTGQEFEVEPGTDGAYEKVVSVNIKDGKFLGVEKKWFATVDTGTKEKLGKDFERNLYIYAKEAMKHGVAFGFRDLDKVVFFKFTEFVPLYDTTNGALCAGVQWWQTEGKQAPLNFILYEIDGYTTYRKRPSEEIEIFEPKRGYIQIATGAEADTEKNYEYENYPKFPIVPLYVNAERVSELEAIRPQIDCYDLIKNGFANNIDEASIVYWVLTNAGGMDEQDMVEFRDAIKRTHIARAQGGEGATAEAHTIDVPYAATEACLARLKKDLYDDYMALDVEAIAAGNITATQIEAAYEPMDEKSAEFEFCVTKFIEGILEIMGIEDTPIYNRQRISNQREFVEMVMLAGDIIDDETKLDLMPFLTPEMKETILRRKADVDMSRFGNIPTETDPVEGGRSQQ